MTKEEITKLLVMDYSGESIGDIYDHVDDFVDDIPLEEDSFFKGAVKLTLEYWEEQ